MTLNRAGIAIAGVVEEDEALQTYPLVAQIFSRFYGFPIYKKTSVKAISGIDRVEGVMLGGPGEEKGFHVECDTVILSGKFLPISQLLDETLIARDPLTAGPVVDTDLMTSVPNLFSAGNVLRGADMHDLCALEGRLVAGSILKRIHSVKAASDDVVSLRALPPIRYVVPQRITPAKIKTTAFPALFPGVSVQVAHTLMRATLEAWSGEKKIWENRYSKVIARHRIPIPVERFNWQGVDFGKGVELRLKSS